MCKVEITQVTPESDKSTSERGTAKLFSRDWHQDVTRTIAGINPSPCPECLASARKRLAAARSQRGSSGLSLRPM